MPQISVSIDEKTFWKLEIAAQRQSASISRQVVEQTKAKVDPVYPANFADLFGSIDDETFTAPLEFSQRFDAKRIHLN